MNVDGTSSLPYMKSTTDSKPSCLRIGPQSVMPDYFRRKAIATRVLGGLFLILFAPVILLLMALVCLTSAGPGLYRQERVGKDGYEFLMYKIRTMFEDAEAARGPTWCLPGDSRITCVGKILRFLHLDELPQLINIARGEMDLIGPRPERPEFVEKLVQEIPDYAERLTVLPGVTGLAQINLPPDETTDCVRRKLVLDLEYIQTATLGLDIRIMLCTALRMLGIRHGHAVGLFGLNRPTPSIKSQIDEPKLSVSESHQSIGLSNGHFQNGNGSAPNSHALSTSAALNKETPSADAPRTPK